MRAISGNVWLSRANCRFALACLAVACFAASAPAVESPTASTDHKLLQQIGAAERLRTSFGVLTANHILVAARYDATGNATEFVSIDTTTRKQSVIATGLRNSPSLLFTDAKTTVASDLSNDVVIFDSATGKVRFRFKPQHVPKVATVIGNELWLAGNFNEGGIVSLDRYNLSLSCASLQSVSCCENFAIQPDVSGQTLRRDRGRVPMKFPIAA